MQNNHSLVCRDHNTISLNDAVVMILIFKVDTKTLINTFSQHSLLSLVQLTQLKPHLLHCWEKDVTTTLTPSCWFNDSDVWPLKLLPPPRLQLPSEHRRSAPPGLRRTPGLPSHGWGPAVTDERWCGPTCIHLSFLNEPQDPQNCEQSDTTDTKSTLFLTWHH